MKKQKKLKKGFTLIELPVVRKRGFTLIELLVVIAIIGILSSVVLVSLGKARLKAKDARIKSDVSQARNLVESYGLSNGGNYTGLVCGNSGAVGTQNCRTLVSSNIDKLANDICSQQGLCIVPPSWSGQVWAEGLTINGTAYGYAVLAKLSDSGGGFGWANWFCMDSSGNSGVYNGISNTNLTNTYGYGKIVCSN